MRYRARCVSRSCPYIRTGLARIDEALTFELRVICGKHICEHAENAFVLVAITPQMEACFLHRLCDAFVMPLRKARLVIGSVSLSHWVTSVAGVRALRSLDTNVGLAYYGASICNQSMSIRLRLFPFYLL